METFRAEKTGSGMGNQSEGNAVRHFETVTQVVRSFNGKPKAAVISWQRADAFGLPLNEREINFGLQTCLTALGEGQRR